MTSELKFCFYVCPIGAPGSEIRTHSDGYLREVIEPVATEAGYRVERADHDKAPGMVTDVIVNKLIDADLVIADLRGQNPNVMYEVAIRHAASKPIVQMIPEEEKLPFDIGGVNTIEYDPSVNGLERGRAHLRDALTAVGRGDAGYNPVSRAAMLRGLGERDDDESHALMMVVDRIARLEHLILQLPDEAGSKPAFSQATALGSGSAGPGINMVNPPPQTVSSSNISLTFTIQGNAMSPNGLSSVFVMVRGDRPESSDVAGPLLPVGTGPGEVSANRIDVTDLASGFSVDVTLMNPGRPCVQNVCFSIEAVGSGPIPRGMSSSSWTAIEWHA